MSDVNVGATITVDTGAAATTVNSLKAEIKDLTAELNNCAIGSQAYSDASDALKAKQDELTESTGTHTEAFSALKDQLTATVPALGEVGEGAAGLGKQLLVLAANPVVLILAAIVAVCYGLYEAFASSVEGGKKLSQMFAGVEAVINVVVGRIEMAARAVLKFLSGDFKGAAADMSESFSGVGDAVGQAYTEVSKATAALQALAIQEREASVARAAQNAALVASKELLNDDTASIQDRLAALKKVSDAEKIMDAEDIARAQEKLKQEEIIWKKEDDGLTKHAQDIADANIEISGLQEQASRKEIQVQKQTATLKKQGRAEDKEAADKARAEAKAAREQEIDYNSKLLKINQANQLATITDGYAKEKQVLQNKIVDEQATIKQSLEDKKITHAQYNTLMQATVKGEQLEMDALVKKHQKEIETNNVAFQKELAAIVDATKKDSSTNSRAKERAAVDDEYQQKRAQVMANEKLTEAQREQLVAVLALQAQAQQKALDAKYKTEDTAKALAAQKTLLTAEYNVEVANKKATYAVKLKYYNDSRALDRQELVNKQADMATLNAFDQATTQGRIALSAQERQAKINDASAVSSALTSFSDILGKQSAAGKVLAVSGAIINTYLGATKALSQGGIVGIAGAAVVIATGLESVKKIISTPVPGAGSGGSVPSASSTSPAAPVTPQAQTTALSTATIQSVGNAAASGTNRAYVVESDITNSQQRIATLNQAARIG